MIKKLLLSLLFLASPLLPACSKVGTLLDWTTAAGISRANLNYNPILLKTAHDDCADSLNAVLGILGGYSTALTLVSNGDMRLTTDNDANGTGNVFSVTTNSITDTLLKLVDTHIHRLYGHLTIDSNLTVSKKLIVTDSARIPSISSALSLAQTLGVTGKITASDSIVGTSERLTGNINLVKMTASDSVIGTGGSFTGIVLTPTPAAIGPNTADGSDNHVISLNGGGGGTSTSLTRGAALYVAGNENASNPGSILFQAGNTSNAAFKFVMRASQNNAFTVNDGTLFYFVINTVSGSEALYFNRRACVARGASVASANDLTLGTDGNIFKITGNTQLNRITTTGWQDGSEIILQFTGTPVVKHNGAATSGALARLNLSGSVDFTATANSRMRLYYDGTDWWETSRTSP